MQIQILTSLEAELLKMVKMLIKKLILLLYLYDDIEEFPLGTLILMT